MSGFILLAHLFTAFLALPAAAETKPVPARVVLEVFTRERCPHCEEAKRFLEAFHRERPDVEVVEHDVLRDPRARERLRSLASEHGVEAPGVPAFYVEASSSSATAVRMSPESASRRSWNGPKRRKAKRRLPREPVFRRTLRRAKAPFPRRARDAEAIEIPFLGHPITVSQLGLPLFTFALGLLDGFNPCSMWVLILMLSMLASLRDRVKMLLIAGTFVAVEGIAYFAFMAAWLNAFLLIGFSRTSEIALGGISCLAGLIHLKDFWALGRGISLSIPQGAKPGIYARMRRILVAENLLGALVGTVVLAVLVQVVELLCTSGFPALYTRILTLRRMDRWSYYGYLLLYDLAYMLDDVLILAVGVVTLSRRRLQEREGRWLKLVSGAAMVGLGVYLLVAP